MVDGGKSSHTRMNTSSTGRAENASMLQEAKMRKELQLLYITNTTVTTKDGLYFMLIKPTRLQLKDSAKTSDSTSTDHSTLSQDSHSRELLSATVLTTSGLEDIERTSLHNNTSSIMSPRLLDLNNGRTMPWKSNPTEDQPIFISYQISNPDGGNSSDSRMDSLSTRKERLWMLQVVLMLSKETSKL